MPHSPLQSVLRTIRQRGRPTGVNACGYLRTESGIGTATRGYIRAIRSLGLPVALADLSDICVNRAEDRSLAGFDASCPFDTNLICVDIEKHFAVLSRMGEEFFDGRYNIGVWWWELPRFPQKWYDRLSYYDEIWVGTSFIANSLGPASPIPVIRIPPVLTLHHEGSRDRGRRRMGIDEDEFVFLFVFDSNSTFERKNPLGVVNAFRAAFSPGDPVRLVIKCVNAHSYPEGFSALSERASGHRISIYSGYWPAEDIRDLTASCDAYVSLHRSEGAGFTISDAMASGKPVIATGWSGNMDFMNAANSFPVRYELVELEVGVGPYPAGEVWAEPSEEHAAELMRFVVRHKDEARARGSAARRSIELGHSLEKVTEAIRDRLDAIALRRRFPEFRDELRIMYRRYRDLPSRLSSAACKVVPPEGVVLVVSKGDDELLDLDGRDAWHFPQAVGGGYAGCYPADGAAAVEHLEALRAKGGQFLLFPNTAFWWLDHYRELREHLDSRCHRVWGDEHCIIYSLPAPSPTATRSGSMSLSEMQIV